MHVCRKQGLKLPQLAVHQQDHHVPNRFITWTCITGVCHVNHSILGAANKHAQDCMYANQRWAGRVSVLVLTTGAMCPVPLSAGCRSSSTFAQHSTA
jgi:hypothetical protein